MVVGVFDLFKIGIGPSSSHTVGPMIAAGRFATSLRTTGLLPATCRLQADLYGSLAMTGRGHATDRAVILGLLGAQPDTIEPDRIPSLLSTVQSSGQLTLAETQIIAFNADSDLLFHRQQTLPRHPNAVRFMAYDADGRPLAQETYYSVGGGFVVTEAEFDQPAQTAAAMPYPYRTAAALLEYGARDGLTIAGIARANERATRSEAEIDGGLRHIWQTMQNCVVRGLAQTGEMPGGLRVRRRARLLAERLQARASSNHADPLAAMEWVNAYALAVNEENAGGGRVVTAPTNGAAGIIPAVLHYLVHFVPDSGEPDVFTFLLTAAAIGSLYKENASISGAEVGCQGEVGVACSMAAAGLAAALGGSNAQIENAAEIGMEHHLGLTCDPVGGLVQVPCIERNAIASTTAINAARMALSGDGQHLVPLDMVIKTMRETGADMALKYKETSEGGLAANIVAC
ncbi:L-serine ammonia-lyase [Ferrovibrio xuzhouensis]|uniref:L-serine dehydratase n=1 Tax=Ferrovibrio xuzhouensis TaxID=1576914 RepID=A0ABV7VN19_9PROT